MANAHNILFVPAWWPCGFFQDQMNVTVSEYRPYVLYGHYQETSRKQLLVDNHLHNHYKAIIRDNVAQISFDWVRYKHEPSLRAQTARIVSHISQTIDELFEGQMPVMVHIQSVSVVGALVQRWAEQHHIPVVITEHVLYIRHNVDYLSRLKESVYSRVDKVLCVSNYLYRNLLTSGFKMKDVSVIGNMVDDRFIPHDFSRVKKNGRIIFVASHLSDKDLDILIEVAQRLNEENIGIDIYGLDGNETLDGSLTLKEDVYDKGLLNILCFKGQIEHDALLPKYSDYSLLLSTSRSETFGLSVAEAIAYGTPVVCTDSGGIRDFVNESNGIVVGIRNVDSIVGAILVALHREWDYEEISKTVLYEYTDSIYGAKLNAIYSSIIGSIEI